jgi:broad specificity phosphatase PhoE
LENLSNGSFCGATLKIDQFSKDYPDEILSNPDKWKHLMMQEESFEELAERIEELLS